MQVFQMSTNIITYVQKYLLLNIIMSITQNPAMDKESCKEAARLTVVV